MSEWNNYVVAELEKKGLLKIEDGNHGEYRPLLDEFEEKGTPFIRASDIDNGKILFQSASRINHIALARIRKGIGCPGDTLFSSKGTVGKVALASLSCEPFICSPQVTFWRSLNKNFLDYRFLYYYIQSSSFLHQVMSRVRETDMAPYISLTNQRTFNLFIPPLKEQKQIADILSCLDNKIDNLHRQNETLEKIAQTLFKHWFIDFKFPNDDGKPYKLAGGAMVASELGDIPEEWRVRKLGEEVETVGGGTPSTTEPSYWENGDIYWYSPTDLTKSKSAFSLDTAKKITKLGLDKSSARLFPKYSVLMTSRATIGEITINTNDACTNQGFITLIPNSLFDPFYLFCWLKTQLKKVNLLASGSTFPELSKSDFRNFDFVIPSNNLILEFRKLATPVFKKIEINTKKIKALTTSRDTLLPKLMSGKIRIKSIEEDQ